MDEANIHINAAEIYDRCPEAEVKTVYQAPDGEQFETGIMATAYMTAVDCQTRFNNSDDFAQVLAEIFRQVEQGNLL